MESKYRTCRIPEIKAPEDVFDALMNVFRNRFGRGDPVPRAWLSEKEILETIREAKEAYVERRKHEKNKINIDHSDIDGNCCHCGPGVLCKAGECDIAHGPGDTD